MELNLTCPTTNNEFKYKLDIFKIMQTIADMDTLYDNNTLHVKDDIRITLSLPPNLAYDNLENIVFECISNVFIKNKSINIKTLNNNEKNKVLSLLPGHISKDIISFITKKQDILQNVIFLDINSPFDPDSNLVKLHFNGFNNAILEFIKILFKINIDDIYDLSLIHI